MCTNLQYIVFVKKRMNNPVGFKFLISRVLPSEWKFKCEGIVFGRQSVECHLRRAGPLMRRPGSAGLLTAL